VWRPWINVHRLAVLGVLAVLLSGCGRDLTPEQGHALIQRMHTVRHSVTLQGRLVTAIRMSGTVLTAQARIHRAPGVVQLQYLTGRFPGWWLIEQDGKVWRISPKGQPLSSAAAPDLGGLDADLTPNLSVRYDGPAWIAHRRAARYTIRPPAAAKARIELALDVTTGYPLRLQRYGTSGQLLSATEYQEIDYQAQPPQRLAVPQVAVPEPGEQVSGRPRPATEEELTGSLGTPLLKPGFIPAGFHLRGTYSHKTRRGPVAEIRYSDGLRSLEIIQFKLPARSRGHEPLPPTGQGRTLWDRITGAGSAGNGRLKRMFRSTLRGHVVRERYGDLVIIVAGELEPSELERVMDSIPRPASGSRPAPKT
jgi:hypothetical protein